MGINTESPRRGGGVSFGWAQLGLADVYHPVNAELVGNGSEHVSPGLLLQFGRDLAALGQGVEVASDSVAVGTADREADAAGLVGLLAVAVAGHEFDAAAGKVGVHDLVLAVAGMFTHGLAHGGDLQLAAEDTVVTLHCFAAVSGKKQIRVKLGAGHRSQLRIGSVRS